MSDMDRALFAVLYPERGQRTGARLLQDAKDYLATEYMASHPEADDTAIDENSTVPAARGGDGHPERCRDLHVHAGGPEPGRAVE